MMVVRSWGWIIAVCVMTARLLHYHAGYVQHVLRMCIASPTNLGTSTGLDFSPTSRCGTNGARTAPHHSRHSLPPGSLQSLHSISTHPPIFGPQICVAVTPARQRRLRKINTIVAIAPQSLMITSPPEGDAFQVDGPKAHGCLEAASWPTGILCVTSPHQGAERWRGRVLLL